MVTQLRTPAESLPPDFSHLIYLLWVQVALVNVCLWESEETFLEVVVFFHPVGPRDLIEVVRLGSHRDRRYCRVSSQSEKQLFGHYPPIF